MPSVIPIQDTFSRTAATYEQFGTSLDILNKETLALLTDTKNPAKTETIQAATLKTSIAQSKTTAVRGILDNEKNYVQGAVRNN